MMMKTWDSPFTQLSLLYYAWSRNPPLVAAESQGNFSSLEAAFPQLANLLWESGTGRDPLLGGQNFTHCCLLAVNESLQYFPGNRSIEKTNDWIEVTVEELYSDSINGQFPCGAEYNGSHRGAPTVSVPAWWYEPNCPGWQLSSSKAGNESEWILPFIGFLLPAAVFCLTVPRRRKLSIWSELFVLDMSQVVSWIMVPLAIVLAGAIALLDTIIWLSICFAFATPMLLSGLYEAFLDNRIIGFLVEKRNNDALTLDMRARLLYVILVGNLDIDPEVRAEQIDFKNPPEDQSTRWPDSTGEATNASSPFTHIEMLVHRLRSFRDQTPLTPRQWPLHDQQCIVPRCTAYECKEKPIRCSPHVAEDIGRTKTRLRTMLLCQYSFGVTVGAPVVFFLGQFIFSLIETVGSLGDHSSSLDLSFGMWYMIIPHLSIVSGLLLAGNNPNTLEGVVALEYGEVDKAATLQDNIFGLVYESRYKPQWLWLRGKSKRAWVERVWQTYELRPPPGARGDFVPDEEMRSLKNATTLSYLNWLVVLSMTLLLLGVPLALAFITGFYTPQIGLSCRSFTFLIYAITQMGQLVSGISILSTLLWMWAYTVPHHRGHNYSTRVTGGFFQRHGFFTPTCTRTLWSLDTFWCFESLWAITWYGLAALFGVVAVLTSIGGTTMQLMGVYNSSKCDINAQYWTKPHSQVTIVISDNSALQIQTANTYWLSTGVTAALFLGMVSFCGWWYQRRLRGLFRELVSDIGNLQTERDFIRWGYNTEENEVLQAT